jgi:hypothetical protein
MGSSFDQVSINLSLLCHNKRMSIGPLFSLLHFKAQGHGIALSMEQRKRKARKHIRLEDSFHLTRGA